MGRVNTVRTCCMLINPAVAGADFFAISGGMPMMRFRMSLKWKNTGTRVTELHIASTSGSWKSGSSTAFPDWPKQRYVMTSIVTQRKARSRSAGLPAAFWRARAVHRLFTLDKHQYFRWSQCVHEGGSVRWQSSLTLSLMILSASSTALGENNLESISRRSLASLCET